jgi:uncharacterized repeat protein (TIGR02543 family)
MLHFTINRLVIPFGWTSPDVTITNAGNKAAGFTMPAEDVTVTANWSYNRRRQQWFFETAKTDL